LVLGGVGSRRDLIAWRPALRLLIPEQRNTIVSEHSLPTAPLVEIIPSRAGEISGVASAHAPFLYFDGAPTFGCHNGIVNVTLDAVRFMVAEQQARQDRVVVAHLRMSVPAALLLKDAIEKALLLAAPAAGSSDDAAAAPKPN
jgi:hypothetical protein